MQTANGKSERRSNFRLPVELPCSVSFIGETMNYHEDAVDISAGGAQMIMREPFKPGELVFCRVNLGRYGEKDYMLTVRWVKESAESPSGAYRMGMQFKHVPRAEEGALSKLIFAEQLRHRKAFS